MLTPRPRNTAAGYTLIEVLVSLVLLAIGLLGLAALQGSSLKNNHSAYMRTQATTLAYGIVDAMRANRCAAKSGAYNLALSANPAATPTTQAQRDLSNWIAELGNRLPGGDGAVNVPSPSSNCDNTTLLVSVTIQWDDRRGLGGDDAQQFTLQTEL